MQAMIGGEVVLEALAQGMPDIVPACSGGDVCSMIGLGVTKPWPIAGVSEGDNKHVVLNPGTPHEVVQGGSCNHLQIGEVPANNTGGGGGHGSPLEREAERIARDVRNGFVSAAAAERDYGVVVDPRTFAVDAGATARQQRLDA